MKKFLALGLLLPLAISTPLLAWGDETRIQASLDHTVLALNDSAILQVSITGSGDVSEPRFPPLPQFTLESTGRSEETTIVNGNVSSSVTFQYVIRPAKIGSFRIGPISAQVDGQNVSSQPLQIEVTANAANVGGPLAESPAAFVTAEVDNKSPYVGQTVNYVLRFYHSAGVTLSGQAEFPSTTGFINQAHAPEKTYSTTLQGRNYQVNEVAIALSPTTAGDVEIGPARLRCSMGLGEDEFLGLLSRSNLKELATDPISLTVRPTPPEGRPDDFSGGVGQFTLEGSLEPGQAKVGQPLHLELTVQGKGNLELVQAPPVPPMAGFKVLGETLATDPPRPGIRKFNLAIMPTQAGTLQIPAISMSTFDPSTERYQTLTTKPLTVHVAAPPQAEAPPALAAKPESPAPAAWPPFNSRQAVPWLMLTAAGFLLWRRRSRPGRRPSQGFAMQRALTQLSPDLSLAGLPPVVYGYLSEKLGESIGAMTTPQRIEKLLSHGASAAQVERLMRLLSEAERARYSPQHEALGAGTATSRDAAALLRELDRSLKR